MNTHLVRLKLILLLMISSLLVIVRSPLFVIASCGAVVTLVMVQKGRWGVKKRLSAIIGVSFMVIIFQLLFHFGVSVRERLIEGTLASLRIVSLSLLVFLFTETTSTSAIISAFSFLPKKLSLMFTISLALIPAILQEISAIRMVQEARGFHARGINVFRSVFPILIPLLNRTLSRAEHIAVVLETRGYEE